MRWHSLPVLLLAVLPAWAQAPSAPWKTLTTEHFRFHYPQPYEAWTMRAASHIESVRAAVVHEVGFAPDAVTDVLVMNPTADANGITLPLLGHPRIVLFTEPPDPESEIGEFSAWIDLLTVHEMTHLVHLLRPSRNPLDRTLERVLPLDPITLHAPRWVLEGYATLIEGRITGSGRPSSSIRAAILRKWAASGRLPSYAALDSDSRFLGHSMAYLIGSAFLEWLEARGGPDSLRHLWARMTARQRRSFEGAFAGVFGDSPQKLYGLFTAELTQRAVDLDKTIDVREGDLWLETSRASGDPAVSPDGSQLVLVQRTQRESKLAVYATGPNEEETKLEERMAKILRRDPQDVAPVRTKPVPREPLHTFIPPDGGDVTTPRWWGRAIVYTHKQPDADGFLHDDLFVWNPRTGENRRVTHLADVKDADPISGGDEAIAIRTRYGFSQLVKVDLATGAIAEITPPHIDPIVAHPRAGAGGRIAWTEHDATGWQVVVDGERRGDGFGPEWGADGLYWSVARRGFIDVVREGVPVTRTAGAALQPAPSTDGSMYFMSLERDGYVVRRLVNPLPAPRDGGGGKMFEPASPPPPSVPVVFASEALGRPHQYGIGRQEPGYALGGTWTAYQRSIEAGVRLGDVVGRLDSLLIGSTGPDRGAAVVSTWRGWPVEVTAHAFSLRHRRGLELRAERDYHAPGFAAHAALGVSSRSFAAASAAWRQRKTGEAIRFAADSARHARLSLSGDARLGGARVTLAVAAGRRLQAGGFASSVVPDSLRVERVDDPALPRGALFADRFRSGRIDLAMGPAHLFWTRYRFDQTVDVRGLEIAFASPPIPLLNTAGVKATAGAAKVSRTRGIKGWVALQWRP